MIPENLFKKYMKYEIEYDYFNDKIQIKKPIEVKKFTELKLDLKKYGFNCDDILVIDRRRKWRKN